MTTDELLDRIEEVVVVHGLCTGNRDAFESLTALREQIAEMKTQQSVASTSPSVESAANRESVPLPPVDLSKAYWRCECGVVAYPLTDDTRCRCSDLYEQEWTRWVPVRDSGCTRYPPDTAP